MSKNTEIRLKQYLPLASRLSKLLQVIGTDTNRSSAYDFLLVIIIIARQSVNYRVGQLK